MELLLFEDSWHRRLPGEICSTAKRWSRKRLDPAYVRTLLYRTRINRFEPYVRRALRRRSTINGNDAFFDQKPLLNKTTQCMKYLCTKKANRKNGAASDLYSKNPSVFRAHLLQHLNDDEENIRDVRGSGMQINTTRLLGTLFVDNTLSVQQVGFNYHNQHSVIVKLEAEKVKPTRTYPEDSYALYLRAADNVDGSLLAEVFIGFGGLSSFNRTSNLRLNAVDDSCDIIYVQGGWLGNVAVATPRHPNNSNFSSASSGPTRAKSSPIGIQLFFFKLFPLTFIGGISLDKRGSWLCERPIDTATVMSGALVVKSGKETLAFDVDDLIRNHNTNSACCFGDEADKNHFPGLLGKVTFDDLAQVYYEEFKKSLRIGIWPCGLPTLIKYRNDEIDRPVKFPPVWQFTSNGYAEFCNLTSCCRVPFFITYANKRPLYNLCSLETDEVVEQFSLVEYGINMPDHTIETRYVTRLDRDPELLSLLDGPRCCFAVEYPPDASLIVKELVLERNNSIDLRAPVDSRMRACMLPASHVSQPAQPKVQTLYMLRPLMTSLVRDELKRYGIGSGSAPTSVNITSRSQNMVSSYGRQIKQRLTLMQSDEVQIAHILIDEDARFLALLYTRHGDKEEKLQSSSWVQLHDFGTGRFLSWFPLNHAAKSADESKDETFDLVVVGDIGAWHRWRTSSCSKEYNIDYYQLIRQRKNVVDVKEEP